MKIQILASSAEIKTYEDGDILVSLDGINSKSVLDMLTDDMPINKVLGIYDDETIREYLKRKDNAR